MHRMKPKRCFTRGMNLRWSTKKGTKLEDLARVTRDFRKKNTKVLPEVCVFILNRKKKTCLRARQRAFAASIDLKLRHDVVYYVADALSKFRDFTRERSIRKTIFGPLCDFFKIKTCTLRPKLASFPRCGMGAAFLDGISSMRRRHGMILTLDVHALATLDTSSKLSKYLQEVSSSYMLRQGLTSARNYSRQADAENRNEVSDIEEQFCLHSGRFHSHIPVTFPTK
eukprot:29852-Pelagococcus_subviridis.AAC.3